MQKDGLELTPLQAHYGHPEIHEAKEKVFLAP